VKHRIVDENGNGVELDDRDPRHLLWAIAAEKRMRANRASGDLLRGIQDFLDLARQITRADLDLVRSRIKTMEPVEVHPGWRQEAARWRALAAKLEVMAHDDVHG